LNNGKKAKCCLLAPIEAEILVGRGSAHKIKANSGTTLPEKTNLSAPNINNQV
jgi:hypothetical protein